MISGMSINSQLTEGQEAWVRVTHITDPHDFYVRRVADEDWIQTFQQLDAFELWPPFTVDDPPVLGGLVVYDHPAHGWARGKVVYVDIEEKYCVFFIDYGDFASVDMGLLRPLAYAVARQPMALHCRLNFCAPMDGAKWSSESIATFVDYLSAEKVKITVMRILPGGQLEVEVRNNLHDTVSMLMVVAERARFISVHQQINSLMLNVPNMPLQRHYYLYDSLIKGQEISLQVISVSEEIIHFIKEERYDKYLQMNNDIKDMFCLCEKLQRDDLVENTPVVWRQKRKTEILYWRALILLEGGACSERVLVYLVDRGGEEEVRAAELRAPPTRLLQETTFALCCQLNAEQELSSSVKSLIKPGASLTVRIEQEETDNQTCIVTVVKNNVDKKY